jgi:hypothetical protein
MVAGGQMRALLLDAERHLSLGETAIPASRVRPGGGRA